MINNIEKLVQKILLFLFISFIWIHNRNNIFFIGFMEMRNTALGNTYINIIYAIEDLEKVGKFSLRKFLKNNCF